MSDSEASVSAGAVVLDTFLETVARLTSFLVTDSESERAVQNLQRFHSRLKRISSERSLRRLGLAPLSTAAASPAPGEDAAAASIATETAAAATAAGDGSASVSQPSTPTGSPPPAPCVEPAGLCAHAGKTCTQNAVRGFLKTFAVGYGVKFLVDILPALVSGRLAKRPGLVRRALGRDTAMFSLFLSSLIGVYKAALCGMRNHRGTAAGSAADWTNAFVAGAAAGAVSMALDRNKSRRLAVALYALTRATQYGLWWLLSHWRTSSRQTHDENTSMTSNRKDDSTGNDTPNSIASFLVRYGAEITMMFSAVVVIYTVILDQSLLPGNYLRFLVRYSGLDSVYGEDTGEFLSIFREMVAGEKGLAGVTDPSQTRIPSHLQSRDAIAVNSTLAPLAKYIPADIHHDYYLCAIKHPHDIRCFRANIMRVFRTLPSIMKLYGTVNTVFLLFSMKRALYKPIDTLIHIVLSSIRSSIYLSTIYFFVFSIPCAMRNLLGYDSILAYLLNGVAGGAAIFIEPAGRRVELTMFTVLRAVDILWDLGKRWRWWNPIPNSEVAIFSAAAGVLMTLYQNEPTAIREGYRKAMAIAFESN